MSLQHIINYFDLNKRANAGMTKYEPWTHKVSMPQYDLSYADTVDSINKAGVVSSSRVTPHELAVRRALRRAGVCRDRSQAKTKVDICNRVMPHELARRALHRDKSQAKAKVEIQLVEAISEREAVVTYHNKAKRNTKKDK